MVRTLVGVEIGVGNAERVRIHKTCAITVDSEAQRYAAAVKDLQEFLRGGFGVDIPVLPACDRRALGGAAEISLRLGREMWGPSPEEGYRLTVSLKRQGAQVKLVAGSQVGLLYGVQELKLRSRFENGVLEVPGLDISSFPAMAIRGIKGLRWNPSDYLSIIDFLPACRFNFLMLCYGMLPEHCRHWRKPYSEEHLQAISEIVRRCEERFIRVCVAVNPSLRSEPPICYSSKQDLELLIQKFRASYDLGVRTFALALDDISFEMVHPEDKRVYAGLGHAHVDLVRHLNDALRGLDSENKLIFCPTTYFTRYALERKDYTEALAHGLPEDVDVFWTGPEWNSTTVSSEDARSFCSLVGRKPLLWLNYPVNDYLAPHPWRLLLEPVRLSCTELPRWIKGLVSNPMRQVEASKIPLWSAARYCWDPASYRPEEALKEAVAIVAGDEAREPLQLLVEAYTKYYDALKDTRSFAGDEPNLGLQRASENLLMAAGIVRITLPVLKRRLRNERLARELEEGFKRFLAFCEAYSAWSYGRRLAGGMRGRDAPAPGALSVFLRAADLSWCDWHADTLADAAWYLEEIKAMVG
ncbi:MAG: beta-N-acetylglucosaminidase domain-containing protein [Firmicutes bacterium]|nr:beta-N-acetylglucosaminidase domain-containing protein [Bacillota bacterium]